MIIKTLFNKAAQSGKSQSSSMIKKMKKNHLCPSLPRLVIQQNLCGPWKYQDTFKI